MTIIKLDDKTIEKIAAGEVIEAPISIVKELVENSIDSGADNITIEIKNGGKTYIRVTDNGCGINNDEIELAFSKHATSKIKDFNDLYHIYSLGFRGEALSSIVTVSKVTAISKTKDAEIGAKIIFDNGKISKSSIATNTGTSIIVEDLFRDIPVRRKFLKSDIIEANHITKLMYAFAVGYNNISFKYIKNENVEFHTRRFEESKEKISKLFDMSLGENLIDIEASNDIYKIYGCISNTNYYRGNRSLEYIFINNRFVDSELIRDRIEYAYRNNIPSGRFPAFFINIETNPKNLDVNIHPNKKVIKFIYEDSLIDIIDKAIYQKVNSRLNPNEVSKGEKSNCELLDFSDYTDLLNKYNMVSNFFKEDEDERLYEAKSRPISGGEPDFFDIDNNVFDFSNEVDKDSSIKNDKSNANTAFVEQNFIEEFKHLSYKCSIFARYSIFQMKDELYILDHRRASEKVNLTKFFDQFINKKIDTQLLLKPQILNLSKIDIDKFKEKEESIKNLGFDVELIGDDLVVIRSVPFIFELPENFDFFYNLIDIDYEKDIDYLYGKLKRLNLSLAFRKGDGIGEKEALSYIEELSKMNNPYKTFDGKATLVKISERELERYFER